MIADVDCEMKVAAIWKRKPVEISLKWILISFSENKITLEFRIDLVNELSDAPLWSKALSQSIMRSKQKEDEKQTKIVIADRLSPHTRPFGEMIIYFIFSFFFSDDTIQREIILCHLHMNSHTRAEWRMRSKDSVYFFIVIFECR